MAYGTLPHTTTMSVEATSSHMEAQTIAIGQSDSYIMLNQGVQTQFVKSTERI